MNSHHVEGQPLFFVWPSHKKKKTLGRGCAKYGSLLICTFSSIFIFSLFNFHDLSLHLTLCVYVFHKFSCTCHFSHLSSTVMNRTVSTLLQDNHFIVFCLQKHNFNLVQFKVSHYDHVLLFYLKMTCYILSCAQLVSFMRRSMWMRQDDLLRRIYLTS